MNDPNPSSTGTRSAGLLTFAIVAGSSILFCSKGVVAKLAFADGADALTVLTLRMGIALPFFVAMAVYASRGADPIQRADWVRLAALGFVGYYVSSLVNFTGLQYVSVALERIILYTYPTLVLAFSVLFLRKRVQPMVWIAAGLTWVGIAAAFAGELRIAPSSSRVGLGAALIFLSAVTYAIFILMSGGVVRRVGALRFTGWTVGISCVIMLAHSAAVGALAEVPNLPGSVYLAGAVLAIAGTVVPAVLLSVGLRRTTPARFAIISAVGPVATLFLAWAVLGETPSPAQWLGFALALTGGLGISLLKSPN